MRKLILATALLACATPALAQRDRDADAIADRLGDRATQRVVGDSIGAIMAAVLDVRIDGLRRAIDPLGRRDRYEPRTVREMIERDDPYFEDRVAQDTGMAVATMGSAARGIADLVPELRILTDRVSRSVEDAMDQSGARY